MASECTVLAVPLREVRPEARACKAFFVRRWTPRQAYSCRSQPLTTAVMGVQGHDAAAGGDGAIAAVRRYNRFYTQRLGLLNERLPGSDWSLAEARLLYELAHSGAPAASQLSRDLVLDAGYVSRILRRFENAGLIVRRRDSGDGRRSHVLLTAAGRQAFAALDSETCAQVARLLSPLPPPARAALVASSGSQGDGDPRPVRAQPDALLPGAQRPGRPARRAGGRSAVGPAPPPAAVGTSTTKIFTRSWAMRLTPFRFAHRGQARAIRQ